MLAFQCIPFLPKFANLHKQSKILEEANMFKEINKSATKSDDSISISEYSIIYAFDRIKSCLNRPELPIKLSRLKRHCTDVKVTLGQMSYNANWKLQVELFQPTIKCLELFKTGLGSDVRTLINYVEFACDVPATGKDQAKYLQKQFIGSVKMLYQKQAVERFKVADYYGRRADKNTSKRRNVLAVYSDRPSKINNARPDKNALPCLHIELRTCGSKALANHGVVSLQDLILFDHEPFWNKNIRIYQLPNLTNLGRLLGKSVGLNNNISTTALRKRATKWMNDFRNDDGDFVMHNALLTTPKLARHLNELSFNEWLAASLQSDDKL